MLNFQKVFIWDSEVRKIEFFQDTISSEQPRGARAPSPLGKKAWSGAQGLKILFTDLRIFSAGGQPP
jgi:hypothetical protein